MMQRIAGIMLLSLLAVVGVLIVLRISVKRAPILPVVTEPISLETWCERELRRLAGPDLRFDLLVCVRPQTAVLTGVAVTADRHAGLEAPSMKIDFARPLRVGEPVAVQQVELAEPVIRSLAGLLEILQRIDAAPDALELRRLALVNGSLVLPDLELDRITIELHATPADDEPGWHEVNVTFTRPEIVEVVLDGRFDAVERVMHLQYAGVEAELDPERFGALPLIGSMALNATGSVHLDDPARTDLEGRVTVSDGRARCGVEMPLEWLELSARLDGTKLHTEPLYVHVLGGAVRATGSIDGEAGAFAVEVSDVQLGLHPVLQTIFGPMGLGDDAVSHGSAQVLIRGDVIDFEQMEFVGPAGTVVGTGTLGRDSVSLHFVAGEPPVTFKVSGRPGAPIVERSE